MLGPDRLGCIRRQWGPPAWMLLISCGPVEYMKNLGFRLLGCVVVRVTSLVTGLANRSQVRMLLTTVWVLLSARGRKPETKALLWVTLPLARPLQLWRTVLLGCRNSSCL